MTGNELYKISKTLALEWAEPELSFYWLGLYFNNRTINSFWVFLSLCVWGQLLVIFREILGIGKGSLVTKMPDLYKSIQTLKSIQIQFPNFELSWIESLHKNGIHWITYLLEKNWVWIELSLSTRRKNWIWFESSLTQKNLKELRVCKTWMRIHESTHCWLETFSLHHEISIECN